MQGEIPDKCAIEVNMYFTDTMPHFAFSKATDDILHRISCRMEGFCRRHGWEEDCHYPSLKYDFDLDYS